MVQGTGFNWPDPHHQDLLLQQQVLDQLLVVVDLVHVRIEAREGVQGAAGLDAAHPGDRVQTLPRDVALLEQPAAGQDQVLDALMPAERDLDCVLSRHVGAQAGRGEQVDALEEAGRVLLRAGDRHPPRPVSGHPVGLREAVVGQAQQVGGEGGQGDVLGVVVEDLVVDLVGQEQQLVPAGQLHQLFEYLERVHGARRVVRVDDQQGLGLVRDLRLDVLDVGIPLVGLVAQVVHRRAPGQGRHRRPQRVVRRRDQHLVAVVEQGLHRHRDQLGDAVAEVDVVDVELREARHEFVAGDDGPARRRDALRLRVTLGVGQRGDHVLHDRLRRLEPERRRVADVELEDAVPLRLEPRGVRVHRPADLVQHVLQLRGLLEFPADAVVKVALFSCTHGVHGATRPQPGFSRIWGASPRPPRRSARKVQS